MHPDNDVVIGVEVDLANFVSRFHRQPREWREVELYARVRQSIRTDAFEAAAIKASFAKARALAAALAEANELAYVKAEVLAHITADRAVKAAKAAKAKALTEAAMAKASKAIAVKTAMKAAKAERQRYDNGMAIWKMAIKAG